MDNTPETEIQTKKKSSLLSKILKVTLPLALGIFIIYILLRDIDPNEIWIVLKNANMGIMCFSLLFGLLGNTVRGYRWQLLINPLGYQPKVSNLFFAVYGTYAVNFALPRAGEVWRCAVINKQEKIPIVKLAGTVILDRILDTLTVITISLVAFLLNMQFFIDQFSQQSEQMNSVKIILTSVWLYLGIIITIVVIIVVFKGFKHNKIVKKINEFLRGVGNDLKAIWKMKTKGKLFFYTFCIWASYFLYFYTTFYAFDFTKDLGFTAGLIAFALSSISMGIPSNGGLGPWQLAVVTALVLYGVDKVSATAFATGVFAMQSAWVIICGLFGIAALAIRSRKVK